MIRPGIKVVIEGRVGRVLTSIPCPKGPAQWWVLFGTRAEKFTEEEINAALGMDHSGDDSGGARRLVDLVG